MTVACSGAIDCDIHLSVPSTRSLLPYLDDYWADTIGTIVRGIEHLDLTSYPRNSSLNCRADWRPADASTKPASSLDLVRRQLLEPFGTRIAIANCLHGAQMLNNGDMGAVLCRAINDWLIEHWLDKEPRLRASIVVSLQNPDTAVTEVERLAHDKRFVQVLVVACGEMPLGRRFYWPLYAAAEKHRLPVGVHAGSMYRHATSQSGFPSTLVEDYITSSQGIGSQLASFLAEGVFVKYPALKVVLIESGVTWLPSLMWRFGKDWRGTRGEIPWLNKLPAEMIRDNVRLTLQPFDGPPDARDVERFIEHIGSDRLILFSTDYPHHQFEGDAALPAGLPAGLARKIMVDNPLETYPRLRVGSTTNAPLGPLSPTGKGLG